MKEENTNLHVWNVSELSNSVKDAIEERYDYIRVKGEVSKPNFASSGHVYFSLKDDKSLLNAIIWKYNLFNISLKPEEGLEVICTGRLTVYPGGSKYQIIVQNIELAGLGALLKQVEERRKRLSKEGLFNESNKKPIPKIPKCIGVITSSKASVFRDILHRINERWPCNILLMPVAVQGSKAAKEITDAINIFESLKTQNRLISPDVLIIARGGGSVEDLSAFNEEIVVRAVWDCSIPIISGVGHETDNTLIDFVSDLRAPTPSAAAELASPVKLEFSSSILDFQNRIERTINIMFDNLRNFLKLQSKIVNQFEQVLERPSQRLDIVHNKFKYNFNYYLSTKIQQLSNLRSNITHPNDFLKIKGFYIKSLFDDINQKIIINNLNQKAHSFSSLKKEIDLKKILLKMKISEVELNKLIRIFDNLIFTLFKQKYKDYETNFRLLENSNLTKVFSKGFVKVQKTNGQSVSKSKNLSVGEKLDLIFLDGKIKVKVIE